MKKFSLLLIVLCVCFIARADALKNLNQLLARVHSASAGFTQTVMGDQGQVLQSSSGVMRLLKPGYFWWQIQKPNEQLIVVKKNKVYFYQADLQQLTIKPFDVNETQTPATLLMNDDIDVLAKQYTVRKETERNLESFTLLPRTDNQLLKSIVISFHNEKLAELDLADHLNHLTKVSFHQVSVNPAMNSSAFLFNIPKGTDVIQE